MTLPVLVALTMGSACGGTVDDGGNETGAAPGDAGSGSTSNDSASSVADASTTSAEPVDCNGLTEDACMSVSGCQTVKGADAMPEGDPGQYYCSDLALPFACAQSECEPVVAIVVLCSLDDPGMAKWIIPGECIPAGWEPCPDAMCM